MLSQASRKKREGGHLSRYVVSQTFFYAMLLVIPEQPGDFLEVSRYREPVLKK